MDDFKRLLITGLRPDENESIKRAIKMNYKFSERVLPLPSPSLCAGKYEWLYSQLDIFESISNTRGDYDKWKRTIQRCRKNPILKMLIAASFASPLFFLLGITSGVFNIWGKSGIGKTLALMLSLSVWGDPDPKGSPNLSESLYIADVPSLSFLPCVVDEFSTHKILGPFLDTLFSAKKQNYAEHLDNFAQYLDMKNRVFLLASEEPLEEFPLFYNCVVFDKHCCDMFDNANKTRKTLLKNYGFAGREFVGIILNAGDIDEKFCRIKASVEKKIISNPDCIDILSALLLTDRLLAKFILPKDNNPLTISEIADGLKSDMVKCRETAKSRNSRVKEEVTL